MRYSAMFLATLREAPADVQTMSHQLLLRAGFIRPLATGIYSLLPLGVMATRKIEGILREEIEKIGGQEISMPVVHPAELWQESGRWYTVDAEMGRFTDRNDRPMVLGMTHEEVVADLVRKLVQSYKQLPRLVYQIQTKWRDDPRPRAGLIRTREFVMKDSYSLDASWEGLDKQYRAHHQAYYDIFHRCGLDAVAVRSDTGMMGGKLAHEYMVFTEIGEDTVLTCASCLYAANRQIASMKKFPLPPEEPQPLEKVFTPDCKTIEEVAGFLKVSPQQTAKAVFFMAGNGEKEEFIFAVLRGDMEINETKLAHLVGARALRPATEAEILEHGITPGFASPVGVNGVRVVVDDLIPLSANLVAGANELDYHMRNTNYGRDYEAEFVADIAAAQNGDACPVCGNPLIARRAVEVGNIFKLGTHFSEALGCTFLDENGETMPVIMGSYGIGVGRLLATVAEIHHDDQGLVWPVSLAPFPVHLVLLAGKNDEDSLPQADRIYALLEGAGVGVLYDDRTESAGVKFNDADLIGLPLRLTVSQRARNNGGIEIKIRHSGTSLTVPEEQILPAIERIIRELQEAIDDTIVDMPYRE